MSLQRLFEAPSAEHPFVISSTSLATFFECRKRYQIQFEWMLETESPYYMQQGSGLHKMLETLNNFYRGKANVEDIRDFQYDEMYNVFKAYMKNKAVPFLKEKVEKVLYVEEPVFHEIMPHIFLRITPDAIYRLKTQEIEITDYKSFAKAEQWDTQLDFQARLYTKYGSLMYPDRLVKFVHRKIRRVPPGVPKNDTEIALFERAQRGEVWKSGPRKGELPTWESWGEEDCYQELETIYSPHELDVVWEETKDKISDLLRARAEVKFYRTPNGWKSGAGSCDSCGVKTICVSEIEETLDEQQIDLITTKRKPLQVNPEQLLSLPRL